MNLSRTGGRDFFGAASSKRGLNTLFQSRIQRAATTFLWGARFTDEVH
jgi:hypothetical protein